MPDTVETIQTNTPVTEAVAVTPTEVVETPVVVETTPETPETPVETSVETTTETPKEATTLIAKELDKTEVKPEPVEETKPEAVAEEVKEALEVVEEPVEVVPPTYETFNLPEGIEVDSDRMGEFISILADLETKSKAGHEFVQEFGQKAVDFHIAELQRTVEAINKTQLETWEKTVDGWREAAIADPEIGGNRIQTTLDAANKFIRTHGGTADQQKEFRDLMETSGLGNNPTMLRLLSAAGRAMSEGTPVPATKPPAAPKSKTSALYGRKR
jgi:hypothetical protein